MSAREPSPAFDLGSLMGVTVDSDPVAICASDLIEIVREEFRQQGEILPSPEKLLVLACVATGYVRTNPLPTRSTEEACALAVAAFVSACPAWWTHDRADYGKLAALLDDVFHQREVGLPARTAMDMLHGLALGIMRRKQMPRTHAAQLAIADWLASLYLAGLEDW